MDQQIAILILVGFGILLLLMISAVKIVPDYMRLVILRLGRYNKTRGPGFTFVIPMLEQAYSVDQREKFLDIPAQTAITKDNAFMDGMKFTYQEGYRNQGL